MKRALFIGRWQPLHDGHRWLFAQKLDAGEPVLIAVRDTPVSDSDPFTTADVVASLEEAYAEEVASGMVKVIAIPTSAASITAAVSATKSTSLSRPLTSAAFRRQRFASHSSANKTVLIAAGCAR